MARQPIRDFFVLLLLGVVLLTLALVVRSGMFEVKTHDEPINATMRAALAQEEPELSTRDSLAISRDYPTAAQTKSGLRFVIRRPGKGPKPQPGQEVSVLYASRLFNGTEIDTNYNTGIPRVVRAGEHEVIPGLDEALLDMRAGEKRTLIVPYWLAFGAAGKPPLVPPKATVIIEVERVQ